MANLRLDDIQARIKSSAIALISIVLFSACGSDQSQIALQVAEDWAIEQVESVSSELANAVMGDQQILANLTSSLMEDQIRDNFRWTFSDPMETGDNRYSVVATAQTSFGVLIPLVSDKDYDVGVNFILDIDTTNEIVTNSTLDIFSLNITEQ